MRGLKRVLAAVWLIFVSSLASAQNKPLDSIYEEVVALAKEYNGERGVKSFFATDGLKLQTVKAMLRKEFGKEFVDNIKEFAIIFYKDAKSQTAQGIITDIAQIVTPLQCVNIEEQLKHGAKGQGYIRLIEDNRYLSDLLIVIEAPSPKLIYFGGKFKAENIQYKNK